MASRSSPAKKDDVKALLGADHTSTSGSPMESPAGGGGSAAHAVAGGGMSNYVSFDGVSSKKTDAFSDTGRDIEAGGGRATCWAPREAPRRTMEAAIT